MTNLPSSLKCPNRSSVDPQDSVSGPLLLLTQGHIRPSFPGPLSKIPDVDASACLHCASHRAFLVNMPEILRFLASTPPFDTRLQQRHPNSCLRNNGSHPEPPQPHFPRISKFCGSVSEVLPSPSVPRDLPSSAWMTGCLLKFPQHFPPMLLPAEPGQVSRPTASPSVYRQKHLMGLSI